MKQGRAPSYRRAAALGALVGAVYVVLAGCGGDAPATAGGACSLATDCALGLVCVTSNGKGVCTSDLTKIAGQSAPDGAVMGDGGEAGAADGAAPADGGTPTPRDSGAPDTGGGQDSGPVDSGAG